MTKVSRNDLFARDERGPEWFNEFLYNFANSPPSSIQEILSAINNKKSETVEGLVQSYREQVGLDSLSEIEDAENIKIASENIRPLSVRHAELLEKSVLQRIKEDPNILADIDSFFEHSGGTKKIESVLTFLREKLGGEVSFSDKELRDYLDERKNHFRRGLEFGQPGDVGRVGVSPEDQFDDDKADYIKNDGHK